MGLSMKTGRDWDKVMDERNERGREAVRDRDEDACERLYHPLAAIHTFIL